MDAPVIGGTPMAAAGTLAIMAGGEPAVFETVKPLLSCMGSSVYTGGPASGSVTKLGPVHISPHARLFGKFCRLLR